MFALEQLVDYLTTQSNIIAAVEQGLEDIDSVSDWLTGELAPMFTVRTGTFHFEGSVEYFQKA